MATEYVYVLIDNYLPNEEYGASVYKKRDDLLAAAKADYELTDEQVEELDLTERLELNDCCISIVTTTIQ